MIKKKTPPKVRYPSRTGKGFRLILSAEHRKMIEEIQGDVRVRLQRPRSPLGDGKLSTLDCLRAAIENMRADVKAGRSVVEGRTMQERSAVQGDRRHVAPMVTEEGYSELTGGLAGVGTARKTLELDALRIRQDVEVKVRGVNFSSGVDLGEVSGRVFTVESVRLKVATLRVAYEGPQDRRYKVHVFDLAVIR